MATQTFATVCFTLVYAIAAIAVNAAPSSKLPKGYVQCKKSDPKLDECLLNGFRKGLPYLVEGVPSLGLNSIDPLRIVKLDIAQGAGPVSINMTFSDLDIFNLKSVNITKFHYDPVKHNLKYEAITGDLQLEGDYKIAGKVLILPIVGNGKCHFKMEVFNIITEIQLKPVDRNGATYYDIENVSWKLIPKSMKINLENLFNGDKALGANMNVFLNENWREVMVELLPAIEQVFGIAFSEIGQNFLKRIPADQLLLE